MSIVALPDPDWYLDHVLLVAPRHGGRVGPVRQRQGAWFAAATEIGNRARGSVTEAAAELACGQGFVVTRQQALGLEVPTHVLRGLVRRGEWSVPRRGVLSPLPPHPPEGITGSRADEHPYGLSLPVRAAAAALARPRSGVSHESAAIMHGLPVLDLPPNPTLTTVADTGRSGRSHIRMHTAGNRPGEMTEWFGVRVTSLERTVLDLARTDLRAGLVAADAALHDQLLTRAALVRSREWSSFRPGVRNADVVIDLASALAESPLESLVRLCLLRSDLPAPEPQVWIDTRRGRYRVDLLYRRSRVVIECDGEIKYADSTTSPLVLEKRRQEALEQAGFAVVRVTWWELEHEPAEFIARVRRKLDAARLAAA